MADLADFNITFRRDPVFGFWSWVATGPDKVKLAGPLFGACVAKENAERDALRRINRYLEQETVGGEQLAQRVEP